ncbi:HAD family hydrolase, partial [bacterium]|nr:HAD family hydrolase [bacterium]
LTVSIRDKIRPESRNIVGRLKTRFAVKILSGDRNCAVKEVTQTVGLPPESALAELTPEQKLEQVEQKNPCIMVGDGANDALALKRAAVGVAVYGSIETGLRSADVVLMTPGLAPLLPLLELGKETKRVIRRNFTISLTYNLIFGTLALTGIMSPVLAAVLMPLSSISVIASALTRSNRPS